MRTKITTITKVLDLIHHKIDFVYLNQGRFYNLPMVRVYTMPLNEIMTMLQNETLFYEE